MSANWTVLVRVRERQRDTMAQELRQAVQRQLEADETLAQAEANHRSQLDLRFHHMARSRLDADSGLSTMASMRSAVGWARALDVKVGEAARIVRERAAVAAQERNAAMMARQAWKNACAEVEKAHEMGRRERALHARAAVIRQDERSEESSNQMWLLRRQDALAQGGEQSDA